MAEVQRDVARVIPEPARQPGIDRDIGTNRLLRPGFVPRPEPA